MMETERISHNSLLEYLRFNDAAFVNGKMYFSARDINGLFVKDLNSETAKYIEGSIEDDPCMTNAFRRIHRIGQKLICVPFMGENFLVYDTDEKRIDRISLKWGKKCKPVFSDSFDINGSCFLVPYRLTNGFFTFSAKEHMIREEKHLNEKLLKFTEKYTLSGADVYTYGSCIINGIIYFVTGAGGPLFQIVPSDKEVAILTESTVGSTICRVEDELWMMSTDKKIIDIFNLNTGKQTTLKIDIDGENEHLFYRIAAYNDTVLLLPYYGDKIWIYDRSSDGFRVLFSLKDIGIRRIFNIGPIFSGWGYNDDHLYLFPSAADKMLEIDMHEKIINTSPVKTEGAFFKTRKEIDFLRQNEIFEQKYKDSEILVEGDCDLTCEGFVGYIGNN